MTKQILDYYLGDGLYVGRRSSGDIELFSHDGLHKTNQVFLDTRCLENLLSWLDEESSSPFPERDL